MKKILFVMLAALVALSACSDSSKKEKKKLDDEAIYREYEDRLRSILGVKTEITRKDTNKGKIEISFNNTEEFEKIYDIIKAGN